MSYSVICPSCQTSFPVDPEKVPEEGLWAQCSMCPEIFEVPQPDAVEAPPAVDESDAEGETAGPSLNAEDFVIETAAGTLDTDAPSPTETESIEESTDWVGGREISFDDPLVAADQDLDAVADVDPEVEFPSEPEAEVAADPEVELAPDPTVELDPEPEVEAAPELADEVAPVIEEAPSVGPIQFGQRDPSDKAKSLARSLVSDIVAYHKDKHAQSLAAGTLVEDFDEEVQKSWKEYTEQVDAEVVASSTFFNDALNDILAGGEGIFTHDG